MIAKGTAHNNGVKLARYLATAKEGERVERFQLLGFAASDIREAFRSVHVMAEATRCEQPFFHVQVRNPDGEELTREQWLRVANRIESKLGLTGQPRAVFLHINEQSGHEHMHVAWSRIDAETLTARPLPFFKKRLKEVSRELENTLDLTRVRNERDGSVLAPTRDEFEQARRLGVDIRDVRQTIRDCWDRSDNGGSFEAALADNGLILAQGNRRDFVVIDHAGGLHALGKRILGVTAGQTRDRLSDLDRDELPSIEQGRSFIRERQLGKETVGPEPMRDPHRDDMVWHDALAKAAIEKEKVERQFIEPQPGRNTVGGREKEQGGPPVPEHFRGIAAEIWVAYNKSRDPNEFADILERKALLACVTKDEADRSTRQAVFAKAVGNLAPTYREGKIVVVTEPGLQYRRDGELAESRRVYQLNRYTIGQDPATIENFLAPLDRKQLQGIDATKERLNTRAAERAGHRESVRLQNAKRTDGLVPAVARDVVRAPAALGKAAERTVGKALDLVGNALESLLAPQLTPEQKRDGERTTRQRQAEAEHTIDLSRLTTDRAGERRQQEQEREAARQRRQDDRER